MKKIIMAGAIAAAAITGGAEAQKRPMPAECKIERDDKAAMKRIKKRICGERGILRQAQAVSKEKGCEGLPGVWKSLLKTSVKIAPATLTKKKRADIAAILVYSVEASEIELRICKAVQRARLDEKPLTEPIREGLAALLYLAHGANS